MFRRFVLVMLLGVFVLPLVASCTTTRPYIWSWPHNKRRLLTILDDFHQMHMDIDRIVFDMDERPLEDVD